MQIFYIHRLFPFDFQSNNQKCPNFKLKSLNFVYADTKLDKITPLTTQLYNKTLKLKSSSVQLGTEMK